MYICTRVKEVIYTANFIRKMQPLKQQKNKMGTLNTKLEKAIVGTRGLVRISLIQLRENGSTSTGKNQNRKNHSWTKEVCDILSKNRIPCTTGNDAPRGGVCGEFVSLTSKSQLFQIEAEKEFKRRALNNQKLMKEAKEIQSEIKILENIKENKEMFDSAKEQLSELKANGDKEQWHVLANKAVQFACNNDMSLGWSNIYKLIQK